ncbi:MAG: dipeptidase [Aminobacterium colombiense]|jgi:membrane dipeptidase|nr:dipeptidase [Aminobacterium sp. EBM-42]MDD2379465.1 dipeptidase [Aminobacterium colombiense]MDD4265821.1 dipeptidase [Aminobacterium colombiense]MDD4586402.1 dipeptidase [Aminobacterium colombiense]
MNDCPKKDMTFCLKQAEKLHKHNFVVDAHFDLLPLVLAKRQEGKTHVIEKDYLPSLRAGGVGLVISSLFIPDEFLPEMGLRRALDLVSALYSEIEESPGLFSICRNTKEIKEAHKKGELAILLSFEGLEPIGNDLSLLRIFYELGVRGAGLTWSRRNYAADGCFFSPVQEGRKGGLTDFGLKVVSKAVDLGMYIDISHLNDEGVEDLFAFYEGPVMASHSNCRNLTFTMRNLPDAFIQRLASRGGVLGMNVCSSFVGDPEKKLLNEKDLADHVDHIRNLVGIEHIGLGFDFCDEMRDFSKPGPHLNYDCIKGYGQCVEFTAELLARGYSEEEVVKIIGGNFMRFLEETIH